MYSEYLISIVGPTAIGKTKLSIDIANHFKAPILSCDSRQFYKEMSIGTAVPSDKEQASATHYFIQNKSIFDDYNVGQFEKDALHKLNELFKTNSIVIMVGGSGLYADAVINGLDYFPDINPEIRAKLNKIHQKDGLKSLQEELKQLDPASYQSIDLDNAHRVIRALEVCKGTGLPYSSFKNKTKDKRNFKTLKIGLTADREILYNHINKRVDVMFQKGLVKEVKKLYKHRNLNALQTVGYRELFKAFDKYCSVEEAKEEIAKNTRRFAKRQLTWFKKDPAIKWFDYLENTGKIIDFIIQKIENKQC